MGQSLGTRQKGSVEPNILYVVYLAWLDAWLSLPEVRRAEAPRGLLSLNALSQSLSPSNLPRLLEDSTLRSTIQSLRFYCANGSLTLGGDTASTCEETDLLSAKYSPHTDCECDGYPPDFRANEFVDPVKFAHCRSVNRTLKAMNDVQSRTNEWDGEAIFTPDGLRNAVNELILAKTETWSDLDTCRGPGTARGLPSIEAPDRRPHPLNDTSTKIASQLYPTSEGIKLCADAKHFFAMAAGASGCDYGLARAIADSGNDILIGDYCEAADDDTLELLRQNGAAAVGFLKLCTLGGLMSNWQFDNLMAGILQFRVLGYYRDHARPHLPDGLFGSRITGLAVHRHIDLGLFNGVIPASLATGEQLSKSQYLELAKACAMINDLIDLRSDTRRKQHENVVLRGLRGNICVYFDRLIGECLDTTATLIESSRLCALVLMSFCNWSIMGSHHKVYELTEKLQEDEQWPACRYTSVDDLSREKRLLDSLAQFGTLGAQGPSVSRRRVELDKLYSTCLQDQQRHTAWLADMCRSLLHPPTLRRLVDVVHYRWHGNAGDVDYCP